MSTVIVRLCGYTATVKVVGNVMKKKFDAQDIEIDDLLDGGANALNINRFELQARSLVNLISVFGRLSPVGCT